MKLFFQISLILLVILLSGCDKGIEPYPESQNTGFAGTVTFKGEWSDSVKQTRIVVFKELINDSTDFFPPNLSYFTDNIPNGTELYQYKAVNDSAAIFTIQPGTYKYIAVAQSFKETLSLARKDWTVAGIYYSGENESTPGTLIVEDGILKEGVDILCDFDNPPPQPPGG